MPSDPSRSVLAGPEGVSNPVKIAPLPVELWQRIIYLASRRWGWTPASHNLTSFSAGTIFELALVSRSFAGVALPLLYHRLELTTGRLYEAIKLREDRYEHVAELVIGSNRRGSSYLAPWVIKLLPKLPNLRRLLLPGLRLSGMQTSSLIRSSPSLNTIERLYLFSTSIRDPAIVALLADMPSLLDLRIWPPSMPDYARNLFAGGPLPLLAPLRLTRLKVSVGVDIDMRELPRLLAGMAPTLRSLTVAVAARVELDFASLHLDFSSFNHLVSLDIDFPSPDATTTTMPAAIDRILSVVASARVVKHLRIHMDRDEGTTSREAMEMAGWLRRLPSSLRELEGFIGLSNPAWVARELRDPALLPSLGYLVLLLGDKVSEGEGDEQAKGVDELKGVASERRMLVRDRRYSYL